MMNRRIYSHGFTLLELLVAITVLSIVSMIAWRGLDPGIKTRRLETEVVTSVRCCPLRSEERDRDQVANPAFSEHPRHDFGVADGDR